MNNTDNGITSRNTRTRNINDIDDKPPLTLGTEDVVFREVDGAHFTVKAVNALVQGTGTAMTLHFAQVKDGIPGVICVPVYSGRLLLARHWRPTTEQWGWEFPRGMGERGETPHQTAFREFTEETKLPIGNVCILMQGLHADTGIIRDSIAVAEIQVTSRNDNHPQTLDADWELAHPQWITPTELETMIRDGEICDSLTITAYMIWKLRRR